MNSIIRKCLQNIYIFEIDEEDEEEKCISGITEQKECTIIPCEGMNQSQMSKPWLMVSSFTRDGNLFRV
jgi:hypothetical protein